MSSALLVGAFDLFNVRHLDVVDQLSQHHDHLTAVVLDDASVSALNGRAAVVPEHERVELLRHVRGIDHVVLGPQGTSPEVVDTTVCYAIAGEPVPTDLAVIWVSARRDTTSTAVREATAPLSTPLSTLDHDVVADVLVA